MVVHIAYTMKFPITAWNLCRHDILTILGPDSIKRCHLTSIGNLIVDIVLRLSYLQNGISYTGKTTSLYWIGALVLNSEIERELVCCCTAVPSADMSLTTQAKLVLVFHEKNVIFLCHLNPLRAKFFRGNINIYLHFVSFLQIDVTQVFEILPQIRQEPTYST